MVECRRQGGNGRPFVIDSIARRVRTRTLDDRSILAVIFGHVALSQIDKRGEDGRGMAIAGLVLGYIGLAGLVVVIIAVAASSSA